MKKCMVLVSLALMLSANAEQVALYDFTHDSNPSQVASHISTASQFSAVFSPLKGRSTTTGNPLPSYLADAWVNGVNCVELILTLEPGYALTVEEVTFDYMSEFDDEWQGPTHFNVLVGPRFVLGSSLSGGWQSLVRDQAWHSAPPSQQSGALTPFMTGAVAVRIHGQGASHVEAFWWLDNITVNGVISYSPPQVTSLALTPAGLDLAMALSMTGLTHYVEASTQLASGTWTPLHSFVGTGAATNWTVAPDAEMLRSYRVRIDP